MLSVIKSEAVFSRNTSPSQGNPFNARTVLLLVVIGVSLVAIGVLVLASLRPSSAGTAQATRTAGATTSVQPQPVTSGATATSTSSAELDELRRRLTALESSVIALTDRVDQLANRPTAASSTVPIDAFKKQTIFLGSDKTTQRDWTNTGVEITLNSGDFYAGAPVVFEASLSIEGGEAHARLVNSTTGGILTQTELSHNRGTAVWKNSPPFPLPGGSSTLTVQLRSTSGERAFLEGARLVIGS